MPHRTRTLIRSSGLAAATSASLLLTGCSAAVGVEPAADADNPLCAQVYSALPDAVAGFDRTSTTAQGAAAWTGPGADGVQQTVVLRCGVDPPGPSPDCQAVAGGGASVDWVYGEPRDGRVTWTTYGRSPAVALEMPADEAVTFDAPLDVGPAVAQVPQQRACT